MILSPSYSGPLFVDDYLRKTKSQSSIGRIISSYNTRYFALDLEKLTFYYLPEKKCPLSNATNIALNAITKIYIDQLIREKNKIWKYGFVVRTKTKAYHLISNSQKVIEQFLFAFAHIINTETNTPLFDWNSYRKEEYGQPLHLNSLTSGSNQGLQQHRKGEKNNTGKYQLKAPRNNELLNQNQSINRKEKVATIGDHHETKGIEFPEVVTFRNTSKKEGNTTTEKDECYQKMIRPSESGVGSSNEVQPWSMNSDKHFETDNKEEDERKTAKFRERVDISYLVGHQRVELEQTAEGSSSNKVSSLKSDISQGTVLGAYNIKASKTQGSLLECGIKKEETGGGPMKPKIEDLSLYQKKKSSSMWDYDQGIKAEKALLKKLSIKKDEERKMKIGDNMLVSFPRVEETSQKRDLPASYLSMMEEARRNSPFLADERKSKESRGKKESPVKTETKFDDDDWSKDTSGIDENTKPVGEVVYKMQSFSYLSPEPKNMQSRGLIQERKSDLTKKKEPNHKQSEILASRGEVYNDWDDDFD